MLTAAKQANVNIVSEEFHAFTPWGVSGVIIIQESHLTIHTWPEYQYAAVDFFTCGDTPNIWNAIHYLKEQLGSTSIETAHIARGSLAFGGVNSGIKNLSKLHAAEQ
jgi:S-adenosylmethionine decarboxylase